MSMDVIVTRASPGHFVAYAQTDLLMTDFGVTPPVALFGLIKGGDKVRVIFDLGLVLADHPTSERSSARAGNGVQ